MRKDAGVRAFAACISAGRMRSALLLFWATLREIFDERSYERFLVASAARRDRRSYRAYVDSKSRADETKPRCC